MSVRLLYWGRSWGKVTRSGKRVLEQHPYYQLEICVSGKLVVKLAESEFILCAGDMLLLPPGCGHCVIYPDSDNNFYSLKFESSELTADQPLLANACRFTRWCIAGFSQCHAAGDRYALPVDSSTREIVEGLLLLTLKHLSPGRQEKSSEPPIFRKIRQSVLRGGVVTSVTECAAQLNMNVPQLNYQFRKELQEYGLDPEEFSVKKLIDRSLLYLIDRYLDFSDLSLSTIARQMKFNNVYTFSRYCKRLTGMSPKERRQRSK